MKIFKILTLSVVLFFFFAPVECNSQIISPKKTAKEQGTNRVNSKIDNGVDAGFNKIEEGIGGLLKKKKKTQDTGEEMEEEEQDEQTEQETDSEPETTSQNEQPKLTSTTQYDFVPGDKVIYYEDFSQDAIGDFPALWTSNGGGEVKTVNIAQGNWFHMNGENAAYCYLNQLEFPENFIIEFDIIPDSEFDYGIQFSLYKDEPENPKELNDELYPGTEGLHVQIKKDGWETRGYRNEDNYVNFDGQASKNPCSG
jgi:OmpA-OmpF porin, OOP family